MSYQNLSSELEKLSHKVVQHEKKLPKDSSLTKAAISLTRSLHTFESRLDKALEGQTSGIAELQELFKSPLARKKIKLDEIKAISRSVLGRATPGDTKASVQSAFIKTVENKKLGLKALQEVKQFLNEASLSSEPEVKNKKMLQEEFLHIGSLPAGEAIALLNKRYRKISAARALAEANAIKITPKTKIDTIYKNIIRLSQRAHSNLSLISLTRS